MKKKNHKIPMRQTWNDFKPQYWKILDNIWHQSMTILKRYSYCFIGKLTAFNRSRENLTTVYILNYLTILYNIWQYCITSIKINQYLTLFNNIVSYILIWPRF